MDAYQSWALFLIFCAMIILVSGVVLLTYKKPEPKGTTPQSGIPLSGRGHRSATKGTFVSSGRDEEEALHEGGDIENDDATMWQLGEASDDEDEASGARSPRSPRSPRMQPASPRVQRKVSGMSLKPVASQSQISLPRGHGRSRGEDDEEASMLADQDDADDDEDDAPHRRPSSSSDSEATLARPDATPYMDDDAFGAWEATPPAKAHG